MLAATCATVGGVSNCRCDPSGSRIEIIWLSCRSHYRLTFCIIESARKTFAGPQIKDEKKREPVALFPLTKKNPTSAASIWNCLPFAVS
jgi:hypothetical protein